MLWEEKTLEYTGHREVCYRIIFVFVCVWGWVAGKFDGEAFHESTITERSKQEAWVTQRRQ
jgi:hypothetical protein